MLLCAAAVERDGPLQETRLRLATPLRRGAKHDQGVVKGVIKELFVFVVLSGCCWQARGAGLL